MKQQKPKAKAECLCVCTCLRQAARAATQYYDAAFRPAGYRATQVGILAALGRMGPVTVTDLAEETVTDRTTLTRNLKLLERKGMICLEPGKDRRERRVCLTKAGGRALQESQPAWSSIQQKMVQKIGSQRFERLLQDLSAVVAVTREHPIKIQRRKK